ncbi:MAG: amino acid permease [Endozoicomonas sp.]|uniref:amino acid permease n=1 Tax=Endozoicomonas sp. TaxID=1892382 RepID=UPI003D9ACD95
MQEAIITRPEKIESNESTSQKNSRRDSHWSLTLFGTAVGAGVLFLPINAGLGGIWPLIIMTLLIGPMTFLSHRGLTRLCLSSSKANSDITETVQEHFGDKSALLITFGYFAAIFPILMIYGIGITNTVSSLMVNQLGFEAAPNRALLSFVLVAGLVGVMTFGQQMVLRVTSAIVYPLIAVLIGLSLFLVPEWNVAAQFSEVPSTGDFSKTLFLTIPVLVFAFNHSPAISSFSTAYRKELGDQAEPNASKTLKRTTLMLVGFTMMFVYSCVMTLSPGELMQAKQANISILSFFAERSDNMAFAWLAQMVALIAISSSFFGHYMGTREGLNGLVNMQLKKKAMPVNQKIVDRGIMVFITLIVWLTAYLDISVMGIIEAIVSPIIAGILFILPVYAVKRVPAMKKYQSGSNLFVLVMGIIAITGFIVSQLI